MAANDPASYKVGLVAGNEWVKYCDMLPKFESRTSMVLSLIQSYGLLPSMVKIKPRKASYEELVSFHSSEYLDHCKTTCSSSDERDVEEKNREFGLEYDCPPIENMYDIMSWIGGGTLAAAESLVNQTCHHVVNWSGGWHHAQRDQASGFCYVNDIVLAIQHLRNRFQRILYVDLDIHHGDGVENAFAFSQRVFTFSIHKFEEGFFPGTGSLLDVGYGKGKYFSLNVPLKEGVTDKQFCKVFSSLFPKVLEEFNPDCVVVQCGADCLSGDPLGGFNLSLNGLGHCVTEILQTELPGLFLGGGGYNPPNAARCWTYLTWLILSHQNKNLDTLCDDIPETDFFFPKYGPSFELEVESGCRKSANTDEYIENLISDATANIKNARPEIG